VARLAGTEATRRTTCAIETLPCCGLPDSNSSRWWDYVLTQSTRLTFDYQFVDNPGYNVDRGPANGFAVRAHWRF
jgi:hypothetical protein